MRYLGRIYEPYDNSYCINIKTGKSALIVGGACLLEETNAIFKIVKAPYKQNVYFYSMIREYTFVNVKSNKTGNIYRVLFNKYHMKEL